MTCSVCIIAALHNETLDGQLKEVKPTILSMVENSRKVKRMARRTFADSDLWRKLYLALWWGGRSACWRWWSCRPCSSPGWPTGRQGVWCWGCIQRMVPVGVVTITCGFCWQSIHIIKLLFLNLNCFKLKNGKVCGWGRQWRRGGGREDEGGRPGQARNPCAQVIIMMVVGGFRFSDKYHSKHLPPLLPDLFHVALMRRQWWHVPLLMLGRITSVGKGWIELRERILSVAGLSPSLHS